MTTTAAASVNGDDHRPNLLLIGYDSVGTHNDAATALKQARPEGYEFVTTIIPTRIDDNDNAAVRSDIITLDSRWWRTSIVGVIALVDSTSTQQQPFDNKQVSYYATHFGSSFQWALHMDLPAIILPNIPSKNIASLISSYTSALAESIVTHELDQGNLSLWIPVTMSDLFQSTFLIEILQQQILPQHSCVSIMLTFEKLDNTTMTHENVRLYVAECWRRLHLLLASSKLAAIVLPVNIFLQNKRGFPTLSKAHQHLLSFLLRRIGRTLKVIVQSNDTTTTPVESLLPKLTSEQLGNSKTLPYLQYLQHFRATRPEITEILDTPMAKLEQDYLDVLQKPLQPLADHLEFQTYEVFEQDPVKYTQYEKAVYLAIQDFLSLAVDDMVTQENDTDDDTNGYRILVVGAGRGPLVNAAIRAIQSLQRETLHPLPKTWVYAIEKNPSAVLYLHSKHKLEWSNLSSSNIHVQVVRSDLRCLSADTLFGDAKYSANLIVSELLGSFGCNELSPECLDDLMGKTDVCNRKTKSIPARYTSYAAPVSSLKLFHAVQQQALYTAKNPSFDAVMVGRTRAFETPYVVRPHLASQVYSSTQCWSFCHPPLSDNARSRSCRLSFGGDPTYGVACGNGYGCTDPMATHLFSEVQESLSLQKSVSWTCTGILGTFTADLYFCDRTKEMVQISTVPESFSKGMFSWFPLYFPLSTPVLVPAGAVLEVQIWRKVSETKVWYEWTIMVTQQVGEDTVLIYVSPIHNPGGRSYYVSLL